MRGGITGGNVEPSHKAPRLFLLAFAGPSVDHLKLLSVWRAALGRMVPKMATKGMLD
jgi:hypothetical protein